MSLDQSKQNVYRTVPFINIHPLQSTCYTPHVLRSQTHRKLRNALPPTCTPAMSRRPLPIARHPRAAVNFLVSPSSRAHLSDFWADSCSREKAPAGVSVSRARDASRRNPRAASEGLKTRRECTRCARDPRAEEAARGCTSRGEGRLPGGREQGSTW